MHKNYEHTCEKKTLTFYFSVNFIKLKCVILNI